MNKFSTKLKFDSWRIDSNKYKENVLINSENRSCFYDSDKKKYISNIWLKIPINRND